MYSGLHAIHLRARMTPALSVTTALSLGSTSKCALSLSGRCVHTVRSTLSARRAIRRRAHAHAAEGFWRLAQRRFDVMVERADHSHLARTLKETPLGKHVSTRAWVKAGIVVGASTVTGGLVIMAVFQHHLTLHTGNVTVEVTTTTLQDEKVTAEIRDVVRTVLKEPSTKAALREICAEVLSDPQVHVGLGSCIRGGVWHALWPWARV
mmetsp:Transcript_12903/g.36760  ORF Transcript_12903/g.36760 Transcript_12903/m.36760 type:complete len:208 (+) Transcript_12903:61-684(+)